MSFSFLLFLLLILFLLLALVVVVVIIALIVVIIIISGHNPRKRLGEPKVAQPPVAARVDKDVLGLEVAVDHPATVEVLEGEDDAAGVEGRDALGEALEEPGAGARGEGGGRG